MLNRVDLPLMTKRKLNTVIAEPTNQDRLKTIELLNLEPVKFKLIKESGWTLDKADKTEHLYKAYLALYVTHPSQTHVPTHDIDEMWHAHILDTVKYMADCYAIFGHYLHHFPYLGLRGEEDARRAEEAFANTRRLFIDMTGNDLIDAADCGGGGGCGGGDGGGGDCGGDAPCDAPSAPSSCTVIIPDSGGGTSDSPAKRRHERQEKPKGHWWNRIPGLRLENWMASLDPLHAPNCDRPQRQDVLNLTQH